MNLQIMKIDFFPLRLLQTSILQAFHKLHFFEIKLKKAHLPKPYEKHHPWSLGFLALISGKGVPV